MKLLISTFMSLLLSAALLYIAFSHLICGLEKYEVGKGIVIAVLIAIVLYCLFVLITNFIAVFAVAVVVTIIGWAVLWTDNTSGKELKPFAFAENIKEKRGW
jgi:hypothetical protein